MKNNILLLVVRLVLGFEFLWAFIDKLVGGGYASGSGWWFGIGDGNPTAGFMSHVEGPFAWLFNPMGEGFLNVLANWGFMLGLFAIGFGLITGIGFRTAARGGVVLLVLMFLAAWPILAEGAHNPFFDDHAYGAVGLIALCIAGTGDYFNLGTKYLTRIP